MTDTYTWIHGVQFLSCNILVGIDVAPFAFASVASPTAKRLPIRCSSAVSLAAHWPTVPATASA
jgi:hypothetical protein